MALASQEADPEQRANWACLPAELLALICQSLLSDLHMRGPCTLRDACRAMAALSPCRGWREVALAEARFIVRLEAWSPAHLGAVTVQELTLPPQLPKDPAASAAAFVKHTGQVLCNAALRQRSGATLAALHGVPLQAVAAGQLLGWGALRRLHISPGSLPDGGGASVPPFPPGVFPPSLRELDLPVPRHPFRVPGGLPQQLERLTLRCAASDFILGRHVLLGTQAAAALGEGGPAAAAAAAAAGGAAQHANGAGAAVPAPARHWRHLEVHAGRTAGLDLDELPLLAGACTHLTLAAPMVMLSTSEPAHAGLLAAPPVRSLERSISQYLHVLAPALAAARIAELALVATETSFYCRQPGRRAVLDAAALPPAGQLQAATVGGYAARLAWPAPGAADGTQSPCFCLSVFHCAP